MYNGQWWYSFELLNTNMYLFGVLAFYPAAFINVSFPCGHHKHIRIISYLAVKINLGMHFLYCSNAQMLQM